MGPFFCLSLRSSRTLLQALFCQSTIDLIFPACVRRGKILVHCEVRLVEYRTHFRAGVKALLTVIVPHTATSDASEGEVVLGHV